MYVEARGHGDAGTDIVGYCCESELLLYVSVLTVIIPVLACGVRPDVVECIPVLCGREEGKCMVCPQRGCQLCRGSVWY